jgi:uncharacterized membrane protein
MKNWLNLKTLFLFVFLILFGVLIVLLNPGPGPSKAANLTYERARIIKVASEELEEDELHKGIYRGSQDVVLELLTGAHKGETYETKNYVSALYNIICKPGTKVIVTFDSRPGTVNKVSVYSYDRANTLYFITALFFAAMGVIGGKKGVKSVLGLIFTFASVIFVFVPMIYKGYHPIPAALLIAAVTTFVSFWLLNGFTLKTLCAVLGTVSGVTIAGVVSSIAGELAHLTGFNTQEAETLMLVAQDHHMQVRGILFAGILLASLGAIMDVAISIAAAMQELTEANPKLAKKQLFLSGLNIGRDMIGTMSNTLILAFAGSSLSMMIVIYSYNVPYYQLINTDMVGIELIQSMAGSIAVVFTVPIVAILSAWIFAHSASKG